MRGCIIKRSKKKNSDSYSLIISSKASDTGKYKKEWITFHGTRPEAEQEITRILHERDRGIYVKPGKITTGEFLQHFSLFPRQVIFMVSQISLSQLPNF